MNTVDILKKAREIISDESRWTQGAYARTGKGRLIGPHCRGAVCFCSVGAIFKASGLDWGYLPSRIVSAFGFDDEGKIALFNDKNTHGSVLKMFDKAIARAENVQA